MYNEIQIKGIVESKIEIYKQAETKKKQPEFTEVYCDSVDYYERISVHSEIGKFPNKLFNNRAPNQSEAEAEYIKSTFKTTTFPIWERFMGSISGIWNPQNWSIKWNSETPISVGDETPQKYLETDYPVYDSLEQYFKSIVTPVKQKDANGLLVHKPYYVPVKINDANEVIIDDSQRVKPIACIYNSPQIWDYFQGEYALVLLNEKSNVSFGGGMQKCGLVFEFYDDTNIWRIVQTGKKSDYQFQYFIYWSHNLGYLPAQKLKGRPLQKEDDILFQSPFMSAIELMDDVLLDDSYLRIIKAGHAFPHKWEYVDDCEYQNENGMCINGRVMLDYAGEGLKEHDCPKCHGTGKAKSSSPLGVYQVKAPNRSDDTSKDMQIPPFGWVAPDPAIMEFLRKEINENSEKALSLLNLSSKTDVKGSETALGKMIDRQEKESFIHPIIHETFDLFEFSIKCIDDMRYGVDAVEMPVINQPKTSSVQTVAELTAEIASAKQQGLPDIALRNLLLEYLNTRFQTDERVNKSVDLTFYVDRLVSLTSLEIAQKKNSGSVANWEDILHTSIYTFIADALLKDPKFFDKTTEEQGLVLIEMAKTKDAEINPKKLNPDQIILNGVQ